MDCKQYEKWLTDADLGTLGPARQRKLDVHLAECAACRTQLERERRLLVSIDSSLVQSLAVQLPAGFTARVKARLVEEAATPRSWLAGWIPLVTGAAAVVVLVIMAVVAWQTAERRIQDSGVRSQESGVRKQKTESYIAQGVALNPARIKKARSRRRKAESRNQESGVRSQKTEGYVVQRGGAATKALEPSFPRKRESRAVAVTWPPASAGVTTKSDRPDDARLQVLVDQNQWAAIVQLYNAVWSGHVDGA